MDMSDESPAEASATAAEADPLGRFQAAADLFHPAAAVRELPWFTGEMLKIAVGQSDISFDKDPRFADVTWQTNPYYNRIGQGYRLFEQWFDRILEAGEGGWPFPREHHHRGGVAGQLPADQSGRTQAGVRDRRHVTDPGRPEHAQ
jgi:hypothetical protein